MNYIKYVGALIACLIEILFYYYVGKWIIKKIKEYQKRQDALLKQKLYFKSKEENLKKKQEENDKKLEQENIDKYNKLIQTETRVVRNIYNADNVLQYRVVPRYKRKEYLMTENETKFYKVLKEIAIKYKCTVFAQVILYEILEVNESNHWSSRFNSLQNKINRKSIDFTICNNLGKILFCIELDDKTHYKKKRQERDAFLDEIFDEAQLELIHIKTSNIYSLEFLDKTFSRILAETYRKI